ncbi:MAG: hypothetical protein R6V14_07620 [Halanaerobiales bacterium]
MRKILSIVLFVFLLVMVLGMSSTSAKLLDKASPKLASHMNNSLFNNSFLNENFQKDEVILWTPLENINIENTKIMAWAIPSDLSKKEISSQKDLPQSHQKEVKAIGVVIMEGLPNCKNVKTIMYSAPVDTNKRIGILSTNKDIDIDTIRKSIKSALIIKEEGLEPDDKGNQNWEFRLLKEQ